jgi:hypothetical protein
MKFAKIDLLTLLISLFIFSSCEKKSTIGLQIDPNAAVQGALIDTLTITSRTEKDRDGYTYTQGNGLARYALGYLNDPILGSTESSLAIAVNLPNDAYNFGTNPVLDSAVLVLNYGGEFYGDSTANYSIDVHQLSNTLSKEEAYLSNKQYAYQNTILGTYQGKLFPSTPLKIQGIVAGAPDTVAKVIPQMRIRLDNNFVSNQIVRLAPADVKYNAYFQNSFKGLNVQIKPSSKPGIQNGAMVFFNTSSEATSGLFLYYKKQNDNDANRKDTVAVSFPINTKANAVAASISHSYSPVVQNQLSQPNVQFSQTYLQPMAGLRTKVNIPYLNKLKTQLGKIVINKAELVIELANASDVNPFKAAPRLALYRNDIAGQRKNLPDNDIGDGYMYRGDPRATPSAFGGYFDSVNKRYVFVVTSYIQDLLDGKTTDFGTYLSVTPNSSFDYNNNFSTASRAIIGAFKKNPGSSDKIVKLNLYYSKIQ